MIINFHEHLFNREWLPQEFWDGMVRRTVAVRKRAGQIVDPEEVRQNMFAHFEDPTGDVLVKEMDEAGIDLTMIMPLDLGIEFGELKISIEGKNKSIADIARKRPRRIQGFFGVDPRREHCVELFEKAVREWGMKGLKLDPAAGYYPHDRMVYPLYEKATELDVPILFHTGATIPPFRNKYTHPIYLDDVTLDFPEITIIAAHVSFGWWQQLSFLISKKTNLMADISGWQTIASRDYEMFCRYFRDMLSLGGSENFLFATDGPAFRLYGLGTKWWAELIKNLQANAPSGITFSPGDIDNVLYKNALRVLKIDSPEQLGG